MRRFLPDHSASANRLPVLASNKGTGASPEFANEREMLYKLFFDMKKDVTELKRMFVDILQNPANAATAAKFANESFFRENNNQVNELQPQVIQPAFIQTGQPQQNGQPVLMHNDEIHNHEEVEESLNIMDKEKELIIKALKKHRGKRKDASLDLGISERTLYRKLKEYDIDE